MGRDLDHLQWRGQRPWFEIWFAVIVDDSRRRALWIRETLFVPDTGDGRATIWGAWFDADSDPPTHAAKRVFSLARMERGGDALIRIDDSVFAHGGARGNVPGLVWDVTWSGGRPASRELPAWLPTPTHGHSIARDAEASGVVADRPISGRALAMHLWGKRRVPTLQWIWAPWLGDSSLELTAVSLSDRFALGLSSLELGDSLSGRPATAAHRTGLVTATVAGPRRLVHARAWAEPREMVGYAYRDTDERDLMVAQSDIGSAHFETWTRPAPGLPWRPTDERRADGGVAVEIHQRQALPDVHYVGWDETTGSPDRRTTGQPDWPEIRSITALGLTYADHVRETGQPAPAEPVAFEKHARTFIAGAGAVHVPDSRELIAALDALEPGLGAELARRLPIVPAVMDYEGELALVALGDIGDDGPQPFGLAAANDLTARVVQALGEGTPRPYDYWAAAKSFPQFLPVAPTVWAPAGGITSIPPLTIETRVNGEVRQQASTTQLVYTLPQIIAAARAQLGRPLTRGDVIVTGTPAGVGLRLGALQRRLAPLVKDRFRQAELLVSAFATSTSLLRPGDVIEVDAGVAGRVRTRLSV